MFPVIRNVCIEPGAQLLFHGSHDRWRNILAKSTNHMPTACKPGLRQYLVFDRYMDALAFTCLVARTDRRARLLGLL